MWFEQYKADAEENFRRLPDDGRLPFVDFDKIAGRERKRHKIPDKAMEFMGDDTRIVIIQVNSNIVYTNVPASAKKDGVILESINDAVKSSNPFMADVLDRNIMPSDEDKMTAMNSAFFDSGVFLFVPGGTTLKQPIYHLVFLTEGESVVSKTIIKSENSASFTFVEEDYSDDTGVFYSSTAEVHAGGGSNVCFVNIQNTGENAAVVTKRRAAIGKGSRMKWVVGRFGSKVDVSERSTMLEDEDSAADDVELFVGSGSQNFNITSDMNHRMPNTKGNMIMKGVLTDSAKTLSKGVIRIAKNAQKSDSFLAEHALLLSKDAKVDTIPCLEIEANDVRCTHSASVSQMNDEHVFYIRSRCLDEAEARKLAVMGFLSSALECVGDESIADQMHDIIEKKIR